MWKYALSKIELILSVISALLLVIIFLNPPTDYDAGPMMAYSFLFALPLILIAGIFSLIAIVIAVRKLNRINTKDKIPPLVSIVISSPIVLIVLSVFLKAIFPTYDPELEAALANLNRPQEIFNNSIDIQLSSGKAIYLNGCNWGNNYENRRLHISTAQFLDDEYSNPESYHCQGKSDCEIYYKQTTDSLFVYLSDSTFVYTNVFAEKLDEIPLRTIKLNEVEMDSIHHESKKSTIKRFKWK